MRPGDVVWLLDVNFRPRQRIVEKIGRVNFYLKGDKTPFALVSRVQRDGSGHRRVMTLDEYDAKLAKDTALRELQSIDVIVRAHDLCLFEIHRLLKPIIDRRSARSSSSTQEKK